MKTNNSIFNIKSLFFLGMCILLFNACDNDDDGVAEEQTRLFRPVLNEPMLAEGNTIIVNMGKLKQAESYTLEVSRDTFSTVEYTIMTDTNYVEINEDLIGQELFWSTLYQVRATAHAADSEYDSKVSDFGNVRTQRFPTILNIPQAYDVTDVAARVSWTVAGATVTGIKVFAPDDLYLEDPLFEEAPVSEDGQLNGEGFVEGLDPETEYQIAIYSDEELRGWVNYTTREALPSGGNVIDLRESDDPTILAQTLQGVPPEGSIIMLKKGMVYDMSQPPTLQSSVEIRGAYGFTADLATIEMGLHKGFNIENNNVNSVVFNEVAIKGPFNGSFLFYLNGDGTLGEVRYENCKIGPLRGGLRINSGTGTVDKITMNNVAVDSLESYNLVYMQGSDWTIGDIHLSNSTFSNIGSSFIRSNNVNNTRSIIIESSTFYEVTHSGRYIFDWGQDGVEVTNGIELRNNIFGRGWNTAGEDDYGIKGVNRLDNTVFILENNWGTGDLDIYSNEIPGIPNFTYDGASGDLWVDPDNNDFNFEDNSFSGSTNAGDPRWRNEL
ncbi:DUF5123 domain-containing protein [Galbibacter sp. EGI 63066]|uniref:DUF5123 domain-containing protein n=1 Tax=Galbibacter sp. EGI 63066 TaxID=2993559 RepID=UPI00224961F3|nr:DUF5123 domain-containing protein [Galbibacter sp. EGI 63066]MCX2680000.1 DUF5123 domain-containing protein [Galbibacter sp. EGI 63066]